jgi:hypothetical protein
MARYHFRDLEDQRDERAYIVQRSDVPEPEPDYRPDLDELVDPKAKRPWYDDIPMHQEHSSWERKRE